MVIGVRVWSFVVLPITLSPPYTPPMSRPRTASIDRAGNADGRDADAKNLVPSRRQYLDLKAQNPGAILLYRLGDFYETFDEDATILARDARIALTSRSFGRSG